MCKYRVGLNLDPESNAMARNIEEKLKEGKTVRVQNLSGVVEMVAWPTQDGVKDRSGWSILMMDHGNFFRVLYRVIKSYITNECYFEFGWGDIEITEE